MATTLRYGNVVMHNVQTRQFNSEAVYDDAGVDLLGQKITLEVQGLVHLQPSPSQVDDAPVYTALGTSFAQPADAVRTVMHELSKPRQVLHYKWGDQTVMQITPGSAGTLNAYSDLRNGPRPTSANVINVWGENAVAIAFTVEAFISPCVHSRDAGSFVLNNRWSTSESMDEDFYITRTISGKIELSGSEVQGQKVPAAAYKNLCVPILERGFKRINFAYEANPDGRSAKYTIVDRQADTAPPYPATSMNADYEVRTADGVTYLADMVVTLTGSPAASRGLLIAAAIQVLEARIGFLVGNPDFVDGFIENLSIGESFGSKKKVIAKALVRQQPGGVKGSGSNVIVEALTRLRLDYLGQELDIPVVATGTGNVVPYIRTAFRFPWTYGYEPASFLEEPRDPAVTFLLEAFLQTPCNAVHAIPNNGGSVPTQSSPPTIHEVDVMEYSPGNLPQIENSNYDPQYRNLYNHYNVSVEYRARTNRIGLPKAGPAQAGTRTTAVIRFATPSTQRVIRVDAERVGAAPELPTAVDTFEEEGLVGSLIDTKITTLPSQPTPDGRFMIFRLQVEYVYEFDGELPASARLSIGRRPYLAPSIPTNVLPADVFRTDLFPAIGMGPSTESA